jgi:hypothetical protein
VRWPFRGCKSATNLEGKLFYTSGNKGLAGIKEDVLQNATDVTKLKHLFAFGGIPCNVPPPKRLQ